MERTAMKGRYRILKNQARENYQFGENFGDVRFYACFPVLPSSQAAHLFSKSVAIFQMGALSLPKMFLP